MTQYKLNITGSKMSGSVEDMIGAQELMNLSRVIA